MTLQTIRSSTTKVHFKVMQLNSRVSEDVNYMETHHMSDPGNTFLQSVFLWNLMLKKCLISVFSILLSCIT